jgi:hypothetical protein
LNWLVKLQHRWKLKNIGQVLLVLLVFACTGITIMLLKQPILKFLGKGEMASILPSVLYYVLILPLYNVVLLGYGFLLGQFEFFWAFEKRFLSRIFPFMKDKNREEGEQ